MSYSAARTNLASDIRIESTQIGEGEFRTVLAGTYVGGNRNQQEAVCKRFKPQFRHFENEYFAKDFKIINKTVYYAEKWNDFCQEGYEVLVNKGDIHQSNSGIQYLVEPYIRYFEKFTSNSGWIGDTDYADVRAMAAFSHFTYYMSNGTELVCDLQGRHRNDRRKRRFELTDPAICSISRKYGPTDLGWDGIESFFANYDSDNEFTQSHWSRPYGRQRLRLTKGTTFMR